MGSCQLFLHTQCSKDLNSITLYFMKGNRMISFPLALACVLITERGNKAIRVKESFFPINNLIIKCNLE